MVNKTNNKPQHATIEFQDMMDPIGVESKLVDDDHLFKQVFESAFDGIVIFDQHGVIKELI